MPDERPNTSSSASTSRIKRITINIPVEAYAKAHALDRFTGMGYQNILKTAMALGLASLQRELRETVRKPKEPKENKL